MVSKSITTGPEHERYMVYCEIATKCGFLLQVNTNGNRKPGNDGGAFPLI